MKQQPSDAAPQVAVGAPAPAEPRAPGGPGALRDTAALLQLLTDNAPDVLFRIGLGPPPAFEYVSPAVLAMTGYPPEEFYRDAGLGQRIVHPDDQQRAADLLSATHDGVVVRWVRRDGSVVHVEPRAVVVRDGGGRPIAVEGIIRDVTARVRAQGALRESEARLRSVFAAMSEGVLLFDERGHLVECNASAERVLGRTRQELMGAVVGEDWHALRDDGTWFTPPEYPVSRTLLTGEPTRDVLMGLFRGDGTVAWVSISSEPLRHAGEDRPRGVLVSCADVTALRSAWVEIRRREAQLRLAMECAGHEFWELDLNHPEATVRTVPRPEPSRPSDPSAWLALVHPEDRERALAEMEEHVAGRKPAWVCEFRVRGPDGAWRWMLHSGRAVVRDQTGRATRLAGTVTDITEIKRLQERLRDADRMAAVGTLAAGMAHEINNPLAYVTANLAIVDESLACLADAAAGGPRAADRRAQGQADEPGPERAGGLGGPSLSRHPQQDGSQGQADEPGPERAGGLGGPSLSRPPQQDWIRDMRQAVRDAMDGAARVRGIVQGLRQFAQPSRGEERGPVDLKTEIEAAIGIVRNEIAHRARLEVRVPDDLPPVRGAPRELGQVFVNLLVNAAHSIPEGHAQDHAIRIDASVDGEQAVVAVSDDGAGILPADLPHVFEPFFTTKPGGSGTGLGLSVCRGIVASMGGTIEVDSAPGRGSTFRVRLPIHASEARPAAAPAVPSPARPGRGRVLVVDDEPLVARSLARLLAAHDVTVLNHAAEALERAAAGERWDVVLCDLMMPEMSGMELEERLAVEAPDLVSRIVYLTGGAFTERSRAFLASGRPHLEKPVVPEVLRARVAERIAAVRGK